MSTTPTASEIMAAYALDAVDHARDNFGIDLDFTPESIAKVEEILGKMVDARPTGLLAKLLRKGPSPEAVDQMAKMYGGYIGEVLRRRAETGEWYLDDQIMPGHVVYGLRIEGGQIWPHVKVHKRFANGPEDNVWTYYRVLESKYCANPSYKVKTITEIVPGRHDED